MKPSPEDDLKDMFVALDPPPGGLQRLRARRAVVPAPARWPWLAPAGLALTVVAAVPWLRAPSTAAVAPDEPAPVPAVAPVDLLAGRAAADLHPAWIGLGRVEPPSEPLQLAPDLTGALASRRVPLARQDVVLYMLDAPEHAP